MQKRHAKYAPKWPLMPAKLPPCKSHGLSLLLQTQAKLHCAQAPSCSCALRGTMQCCQHHRGAHLVRALKVAPDVCKIAPSRIAHSLHGCIRQPVPKVGAQIGFQLAL